MSSSPESQTKAVFTPEGSDTYYDPSILAWLAREVLDLSDTPMDMGNRLDSYAYIASQEQQLTASQS